MNKDENVSRATAGSPSKKMEVLREQPPEVAPATASNSSKLEIHEWRMQDVCNWARNTCNLSERVIECLKKEDIDGPVLLSLTEEDIRDFRYRLNYALTFSELKKLWFCAHDLQQKYCIKLRQLNSVAATGTDCLRLTNLGHCATPYVACCSNENTQHCKCPPITTAPSSLFVGCVNSNLLQNGLHTGGSGSATAAGGSELDITPPMSVDGRTKNIPPDFFKTAISLGYSFLVTWITSFVMVIVHERVPDMKRYPPLPDIFLDNVPHIPWAFHMCEITGTLLFLIWICVCIFHKYRMVLLRRFFALAGTVFLLRCVTMLITSLSVPGTHLQCNQKEYTADDPDLSTLGALQQRISRAYVIWSGLGMSIQGVRTCGDYMFSGHTVALTLLNFFITEYTPRYLYFLHTLTWLLNMFGIFFILAAHEHYSIDVFVAFYISSRLFLYYHTLANNQALMSSDSNRTRIWFPMFSYFESSVDGIIPNEYDSLGTLLNNICSFSIAVKDSIILTLRNVWIQPPAKSFIFIVNRTPCKRPQSGATASPPSVESVTDDPALSIGRGAEKSPPANHKQSYATESGGGVTLKANLTTVKKHL